MPHPQESQVNTIVTLTKSIDLHKVFKSTPVYAEISLDKEVDSTPQKEQHRWILWTLVHSDERYENGRKILLKWYFLCYWVFWSNSLIFIFKNLSKKDKNLARKQQKISNKTSASFLNAKRNKISSVKPYEDLQKKNCHNFVLYKNTPL